MTVLAELQLPGMDVQHERVAKRMLANAFWGYFDQHKDDVVFSTKVFGFIRISITVKQLEAVFTKIFGGR